MVEWKCSIVMLGKDRENKRIKWLERFKVLSLEALEKDDIDTFIEVLMERNAIIEKMTKENVELKEEERLFLIELEEKVLKRLGEIREGVMDDINMINDKRKAIRTYSSKFPFPSMPAFLDKKG